MSGWEGILAPEETVLWQGRPDSRIRFAPGNLKEIIPGVIFTGFSLIWMIMAAQGGGFFWMFGLIFLLIGLRQLTNGNLLDARRRKYTWYTLTNQRAFVATDLPGQSRKLTSYPLNAASLLELEDTDPPTIWFTQGVERDWTNWTASHEPRAGFRYVPEARHVLGLMRDIQTRARHSAQQDEIGGNT